MFFFLPYRIDRPFRMPWATASLIGLNVVMFVLSVALGLEWTVMTFGFRMNLAGLVTWLSASFLHVGIFHIAGNMYFLWLFGSVLEDALGPWRLIGLYLAGGFASSLAHGLMMLLFMPSALDIPAIGASGALAAIMGLFAVRFYKTKIRVAYLIGIGWFFRWGTFGISSIVGIILWFARDVVDGVFGLAMGASGGVANWAHLGGVAFGIGVGLLSGQVRNASREYLADDAANHAAAGTHEVAAAKYGELADAEPDNPDWRRRQARELVQSNRAPREQAATDFAQAARLYVRCSRLPDALDTYLEGEGWCGALPMEHQALLALGSESERRADWASAEKFYMRVIEERGGTPAAEKALFRLAHVYLGMGARKNAADTWGAFQDLHPASQWNAFVDPALRELEAS